MKNLNLILDLGILTKNRSTHKFSFSIVNLLDAALYTQTYTRTS
jgi:hypothetical protein